MMLGTLLPLTALLLLALGGAVWFRRRLESRTLTRCVRLTAEHAVHVVEVAGRRWMLGTGPAGAPSLLAELPAPEDAPDV